MTRLLRRLRCRRRDPAQELVDRFTTLTPQERHYVVTPYDDSVPLPPEAEALRPDHPRLRELRERYASLDLPVLRPSRWHDRSVTGNIDFRYFRGDTPYVWHWRELPRATQLKFFVYLQYLRDLDRQKLLDRLEEDGLFGCWTFSYPGHGTVSRDLLDSVNELCFLDRHAGLFQRQRLRVLDIGAGYGRTAHRMSAALPALTDYCCVDAVPESTFLSEFYLGFRHCRATRVVPLYDVERELRPGDFDLALNIHSFPECPYAAIEWWVAQLRRMRVRELLVVPNDGDQLLSLEPGGERRDFAPLLERAGYRLRVVEPVFADAAVRSLLRIEDRFHLYELGP